MDCVTDRTYTLTSYTLGPSVTYTAPFAASIYMWLTIKWDIGLCGPGHYALYVSPNWNTNTLKFEKVGQFGIVTPPVSVPGDCEYDIAVTDGATWPDKLDVTVSGC